MSHTDGKPTVLDVAGLLASENAFSPAEVITRDLNSVIDKLLPIASTDTVSNWRSSLKAVQQVSSLPPGVVVGFVGITGAGKSSLINALLGDHIVPTSGFESCTSTPIRISYHDEEKVKARIEFVSTESWLEDIRHLIEALADVGGRESELNDDDTEIWQRINTVYPQYSAEMLVASNPDAILASDPDVACKLGSTVVLDAPSRFFNTSLQSQCCVHDSVDVWPTIAQVSLRCRASVLKDGVTLVDLPGVLDSNAARAAIATEYLKMCDHIFVVASIKRAVTDKVAEDGKYNSDSIAFIATSTDDIQVSEVVARLGLGKEDAWKQLNSRLRGLEDEIKIVRKDHERLIAHQPSNTPLSQIASRDTETGQPTFKRRRVDGGEQAAAPPHISTPPERTRSLIDGFPVTPSRCETQLDTIAAKEFRHDALLASMRDLANERKRYCIAARNTRVRKELQRQFKQGLRHAKGDEDDGEVLGDIRVFTVSAREYLKLEGKIPEGDDDAQPVFRSVEETGVPEVAQFTRQLGKQALRGWKEGHALEFSAVVSQVEAWISVNSSGSHEDRAELEAAWNGVDPDNPENAFPCRIGLTISRISRTTSTAILSDLHNVLAARMRESAKKPGKIIGAQFHTIASAVKHYNTVKAILRREGKWKDNDWNRELIKYLRRGFQGYWRKVLALSSLDEDVDKLVEHISALLVELEDKSPPGLLQHVQDRRDATLKLVDSYACEAASTCKDAIIARQREISREMLKEMANKMHGAYEHALTLAGPKFKANAVTSVQDHLIEHGEAYFSAIVETAIEDLHTAVVAALSGYCDTLDKLTAMIESNMKPTSVWDSALADMPFQETIKAAKAGLEPIALCIEGYKSNHE
ncbi:hypothetical protein AURDEDRAFT_161248 [Auricularia subglabra TFB-10046 SS5]|nr:hypothetical protein AURDEDRAFT_161248 [Auricularia subglabra TFB-10046 SS5]